MNMARFPEFYRLPTSGWFVWCDDGQSWVRDDDCSVEIEPSLRLPAYFDPFAQCFRDHWIEKYRHLFAEAGVDLDVHSIARRSDIEGCDDNAFDPVPSVARHWLFEKHVSLPALQVGAGIGGLDRLIHEGFFRVGGFV